MSLIDATRLDRPFNQTDQIPLAFCSPRLIEDDKQKQLAEQKGTLMSWMTGKPAGDSAVKA